MKKEKKDICNFYAEGKVNLVNLKKATSKYSLNEKWIRKRERVMKFVCFSMEKLGYEVQFPLKKKKKVCCSNQKGSRFRIIHKNS